MIGSDGEIGLTMLLAISPARVRTRQYLLARVRSMLRSDDSIFRLRAIRALVLARAVSAIQGSSALLGTGDHGDVHTAQ